MTHQISLEELGKRGDVVERTERGTIFDFMTLIWFESGACLRIIDTPTDHRVEAFVP